MNYFLDTEFYEDGKQIHLISIGIVCDDGRELYIEKEEFDWDRVPADHWLIQNVKPHLLVMKQGEGGYYGWQFPKESMQARREDLEKLLGPVDMLIRDFAKDDTEPVFYGYFSAYDWVAFCMMFGRMVDLPKGFPYFCVDLKQMMWERGLSGEWKREKCPDPADEHNALADARWNKQLHEAIKIHDVNVNAFKP